MKLLRILFSGLARTIVYLLLSALHSTPSVVLSADSTQIVVTGNSAIQLVELDSGVIRNVISTRGGDANPTCLPNGKGIVFVRYAKYGPDAARELFIVDQQHKQPSQLTFGMDVMMQFSVSPNGEQIAYVSNKTKQVYVVRVDTRQSTQLTSTLRGVGGGGPRVPVWSPDGNRLAFAYFERDYYQTSFHVIDTLTRRSITIPTPPARDVLSWSPWSSDGTRLALGEMNRTIIVDVSTEPPRIIREFSGYRTDVHWALDGTKPAYMQGEDGKCANVYVMDLQYSIAKRVNPWFFEYRCFHGPRWSPDSKNLAFLGAFSYGDMSLFRGHDTIYGQLYVANTDLSVRRVTEDLKDSNPYGVSWCNARVTLQQ